MSTENNEMEVDEKSNGSNRFKNCEKNLEILQFPFSMYNLA